MKPHWLDRRLGSLGPYLTLCLSHDEFTAVMSHLGSKEVPHWCRKDAAVHTFDHADGGVCCVVCLGDTSARSGVEIAGLLVHEAVHVWQAWCDDVGEREPGCEQEAYGVQAIAQELMAEYARRKA